MRAQSLAISCAVVLAAGCGKKADDKAEQGGVAAPAGDVTPPEVPAAKPTWSDDAKRLVAAVPPGAVAVAVIDLPQPMWDYLLAGSLVPLAEPHRGELDKELGGFIGKRLGVDLRGVRSAVGFFTADKQIGVMIGGVGGELRGGPRLVLDKEEDVVAVLESRILAIGPARVVDAVAAAIKGERTLAKADAELSVWIQTELDGALVGAAARLPAIDNMLGEKMPPELELGAVALSRRGVHAVITGDPNTLKTLSAQLAIMEAQAMRELGELRTKLTADGGLTMGGALAIAQYHLVANMVDKIEPEVDGNRLVLNAPIALGVEPGMVVMLAGIAAAVAIPAFVRYIDRSKSAEARSGTGQLAAAVRTYYLEHKALPATGGPTPPAGSCCSQPGGRCAPAPALWAGEPWSSLHFAMAEPHRYSYEVVTTAEGFVVRAIGDLDCDGEYSTFEESARFENSELVAGPPSAVNELE